MEMLRKRKSVYLCFMSLLFMAGMCEPDPVVDETVLVKRITLDQSSVELRVGRTLTLNAKVTPANAENRSLDWSSSDENVATVEDGKVTAVATGNAAITAKAVDGSGKSATCEVVVVDNLNSNEVLVEKIELSQTQAELEEGGTLTLVATVTPENADDSSVNWTSSDENVATVEDGVVTAIAEGRVVVKAVANDGGGAEASCVVVVKKGNGGKALSPTEVKNKLESAGIEFVNAIDAETHNNLVKMVEYAVDAFEDFDIDEAYYEKLESLVEETYNEDYARRRNPAEAIVGLTRTCLGMAQSGAQLSTRAAEVYTFVIKAGLTDLYGKFVPDYANNVWKWNSNVNDRIEASFTDNQGQQWVATLKGSKETTRVHVVAKMKGTDKNNYIDGPNAGSSSSETWIEEYEGAFDIPKQIGFTVKCDGNAVIDLTMNSSLAFDLDFDGEQVWTYDCYWYDSEWAENGGWYDWYNEEWDGTFTLDVNYSNLSIDAAVAVNGYEETFKTEITRSGVTASADVKIDGKSMLKVNAVVNADMDAIIANIQETMQNEDEDFKSRNIQNISMTFDVLGKVQVDASVPTFKNLYDAVRLLEEAEGIDLINNRVNEVNDAFRAKLCIDKTSTTQATFELEAREVDDDWGDSYIECYPVMVFTSNGSRYAIEDYFTETAFEDLIDAVEKLADQFEDFYGDIDL